jgi:hypothetical protein
MIIQKTYSAQSRVPKDLQSAYDVSCDQADNDQRHDKSIRHHFELASAGLKPRTRENE